MAKALLQAQKAFARGEVPVGAVVVHQNKIIASSFNSPISDNDPCAHAEIKVIRKAGRKLQMVRLTNCQIYVTLEPCPMCAQAISFGRFDKLYYGAYDFKGGGVENGAKVFDQTSCFHRPEIYGGIMEQECQNLLKSFFQKLRVTNI